jgi:hypothetical protein
MHLTRGSRYCEKPEESNPNRRTEFKAIYQDSITFPLEEEYEVVSESIAQKWTMHRAGSRNHVETQI